MLTNTPSLQLNIGIIAACASFLKPLVGRFLKINSSVGYYPSSQQYGRSGRTPMGATALGSGARRQGEFELHAMGKDGTRSVGVGSDGESIRPSHGVSSDATSEEVILDKEASGRRK